MKAKYAIWALLLGALAVEGLAWAQANPANSGYVCYTVSVNSSSTPVGMLPANPPFKPSSWAINERAANASATPAAANILVFPYAGATVPAAAPSACASPTTTLINTGCIEVTPTKPFSDAVSCDNPSCVGPIGEGWAAVLESGSTAVTADSCIR